MRLAASVQGEEPTENQSLRFFTEEYAPFSFSDEGQVSGINTELLKRVADQLNLDVEFAVVPWGRAQVAARNDPHTCFFSAARTSEREDIYQWAGPLTRERIVLYSLNPDAPRLETFENASEYRVGGQTNDAYTNWVEAQGVPVDPVTEVAGTVAKLEWGRIDLWLAGSIAGPYIALKHNLTVYPQGSSDEVFKLWLACSKDMPAELVEDLNEVIEQLKTDGTIETIRSRYR